MAIETLTERLQETLAVFEEPGTPWTTPEVADSLDLGRRSTYDHLKRLVDHGHLETKKVGANARVWWRPPERTVVDVRSPEEQSRGEERQYGAIESEFDDVFERIDDGVFGLDCDLRVTYANERAESLLGCPDGELVGEHVRNVFDSGSDAEAVFEEALNSQEQVSFEEFYEPLGVWFESHVYPSETGVSVYVHDITAHKEQKQELERYAGIVDAVGDPVYALDAQGCLTFVNEALVEVSGYRESELLGQHVSIGMDEEAVSRAGSRLVALLDDAAASATLEYEVVTKSGERIPVENRLSVLTDEDGQVRGSAGVLRDITDRVERERELERQREQLRALNNLNDTVRGITDAVIDRSTREEIEATVCEHLAASDAYEFAWIGDVDVDSETVSLRAEAGVEGYLDDVTVSVDPDDEHSQGPTGRALRTGEIQTIQDVHESKDGLSHDHAEAYGVRSSATIPIAHEGAVYGILNVYAERPRAFEGEVCTLVGQLGEIVGHAIAATEQKRALTSDDVVELEFQRRNVFDAFGAGTAPTGTATFERAVPVGDGEYIVYGSATEDAAGGVARLAEVVPHWEGVTIWTGDGDASFEFRLAESPLLSTVTSFGGVVRRFVVEDGDLHVRLQLPPGTDVRRVAQAIEEIYPGIELLKRRQVPRHDEAAERLQHALTTALTERQRTALEIAHYAGFFEWPRDATGEELAETLGVSPPTFSQHLRAAERKIFESLFAASASAL